MGSLVVLGALLVALTSFLYIYLQSIWSYWSKQGVPQMKTKFPFGNFKDFLLTKKHIGFAFKDIYDAFKGERFAGTYMFTRAGVVFRDLELIKDSLVKDFKHFHHRGCYDESHREPLCGSLFILKEQKWKNTRAKLSPAFTAGKMKEVFSTMSETGAQLTQCLEELADNGEVIEMRDYIVRYFTDISFSFVLGLECNSLTNPDAEYRELSRKIMRPGFVRSFAVFLVALFPSVSKLIPLTTINPKISKIFRRVFVQSLNYHESNSMNRENLIQYLIQLKNKGAVDVMNSKEEEIFKQQHEKISNKLSMNNLAAQAYFFFLAGLETSSSIMTFCLYELALNVDIQRRLQQEIDFVTGQHSDKITYEAINAMTYLDMVVSETLRKYPPIPIILREVTFPFLIPDTNVILKKGTPVYIPVLAVHHDPQYYPDPEKFDPERFNEQEKAKRPKYSYMPFGGGPRMCIGKRYGLVQIKLGIISMLSRYNVDVSEKTQIPPVIDPIPFAPSTVGGVWLKITKRKNLRQAD